MTTKTFEVFPQPYMMGLTLEGLERCPYCHIAKPLLSRTHEPIKVENEQPLAKYCFWATYSCSSCKHLVLAKSANTGSPWNELNTLPVENVWPSAKPLSLDIPQRARNYLQQAIESVLAPDGAAMLSGSAVDAMLKDKGYKDGSVYHRIEAASKDGILTKSMADWAHEVRLGSNRPRHSDDENPHVSDREARQSIEFAEALAQFLFVLPARVKKGIEDTSKSQP